MLERYRLPARLVEWGILLSLDLVLFFPLQYFPFWRIAYDTPFVFRYAVIRGLFAKLAGDSATTPSLGTACCGRDGTGDNASALSLGFPLMGQLSHVRLS